jgi:hypothetical protein
MQKVVGSSPIIRSRKPRKRGFFMSLRNLMGVELREKLPQLL